MIDTTRSTHRRAVLLLSCAAAALAPIALAAGAPRATGGDGPVRVAAATIAPLTDLTARVAGAGWTVRTVVPPGRSPHVFEPTPGDVKKIAPAELVVTVGAGYDDWVLGIVTACSSSAAVHDAGASVGIRAGAEHDHERDEGVLGRDPHWWLSPVLAARALGPIAGRFASLDPANAGAYRARADAASAALLRLDATLARVLEPLHGRAFLSAHAAWAYFADRYGLRPVGSIEPVPGREPSPWQLRDLIREARADRRVALFTEPQFPEAAARVIAEEAGIRVLTLDPIGGVPGRETYEELLLFDAEAFRRGLGSS